MSDFDLYTILPSFSPLKSRSEARTDTLITKAGNYQIVAEIPIIASPMSTVTEAEMAVKIAQLGGIGIIHRYLTVEEQTSMVKMAKDELMMLLGQTTPETEMIAVGAAIGANKMEERVDALMKVGADVLVGDVAHGDSQASHDLLRYIKKNYGDAAQVISPNIATAKAAETYWLLEADGFRVGIGAGSVCTTRKVAGVGRNQLRAIVEIHRAYPDTPITSCGGIRDSGDIVKALAAGAESVIIGRLFAACDESPAPRLADGRIIYAGMASYFAEEKRAERTGEDPSDIFHITTPEGKQDILDKAGQLKTVVARLVGGVQAGMSYLGARTIQELQEKAVWEDEAGRPVDWL